MEPNKNGILAEVYKELREDMGKTFEPLHLVDQNEHAIYLIRNGSSYKIERVWRGPQDIQHSFKTIEGLVDYLKSPHCSEEALPANATPIIMVGSEFINANLAEGQYNIHTADLVLTASAEWRALQTLERGVGQAKLFDLLANELYGCFDPTLYMTIKQINYKKTEEAQVSIDTFGMKDGSASIVQKISFPGKNGERNSLDIAEEWEWKGRIWDSWDEEFTVTCRLTMDTSSGLMFKFTPRRPETVLRKAHLDLVEMIKGQIPEHMTCHEGV